MTGGQHLLLFKVRGQRSRSLINIVVKPCKQDYDRTVTARTVKLCTHTSYDKRTTPIAFQSQGSNIKVIAKALLLIPVNKKDRIWVGAIKLDTNTC